MEFPVDFVFNFKDMASGAIKSLDSSIMNMVDTMKVAVGVAIERWSREAVGAIIKTAGDASQAFQDFESSMTRVMSATSTTGAGFEDLQDTLQDVALAQTDLGFSGADAARAIESLVKAGMDGKEAAEALESALGLARLESISTEQAAAMLVQTLTMFNLTANNSAGALDSISRAADAGIGTATDYANGLANAGAAAANMGLSLEETLAALVMLDKTYGDATSSGTFLNAMFKDLIAKSGELSISLYNTDGSMKTLDEIVTQLRNNVAGYGDNQEAVNEYLSVFDIRAQKAAIGLINYNGSIIDIQDSMEDARSVQDKLAMSMETTAGRIAELEAKQRNASLGMGEFTANLQLMWLEFASALGPIGQVVTALGPSMLQGAMQALMMVIPQMIVQYGLAGTATKLLSLATSTLGLSIAAAVGSFGLIYTLLNALPADIRGIASVIAILVGSFVALAAAAAVAWGVVSLGTAVPIILAGIGTAAAGVAIAMQQAGADADSLSSALNGVSVSAEATSRVLDESLGGQLAAIETGTQNMLDDVNTKYDLMVQKVKDSYDEEYAAIVTGFDDQYSDMQTSYDEQIAEVSAFYDEMVTTTQIALNDIRDARRDDLNDLELTYLLEKQALDNQLEAKEISQKEYEQRLNTLETDYRTSREGIREDYRIQELQAEIDHNEAIETKETEGKEAIEGLEQQKSDNLQAIETAKNIAIEDAEETFKTNMIGIETARTTETEGIVQLAEQRKESIIKTSNATIAGLTSRWANEMLGYYKSVNLANITAQTQAAQSGATSGMTNWGGAYVPVYQHGGKALTRQLAIVAESEPEWIIPESKLTNFITAMLPETNILEGRPDEPLVLNQRDILAVNQRVTNPQIPQIIVDIHDNTFSSEIDVKRVFEIESEALVRKLYSMGIGRVP